ncbi:MULTISPECIES: methyltransferase domain-containing protein [unclassified Microcoleus]|uniref:methyltransferase domain-containing protein n=1 Tax=unclassified Microcoleus TaxID=2642155 RepID=UPI002FD6F053
MQQTIIKLLKRSFNQDNSTLNYQLTLSEALAQIDRLFGCDRILKEFDTNITVPYYTQSELGYRFYHSERDAIHMALNFDGVFKADGYYVQPQIVGAQIDRLFAKDVLEIGCGKGFNSQFLAEQYPNVKFTGVDLTPLHIKIATQKNTKINNLSFKIGDFNKLDFPDESFDIVFAFECLCHAKQPQKPLAEIFRILRPGGQLIVFDGYRKAPLATFDRDLQMATCLTEASMAVQHGFAEIENWLALANSAGFNVEKSEDLSFAILPTLGRLKKLSLNFLHSYWRAKVIAFLLPKYLVRNSIAGLLMGFILEPIAGSCSYYKVILGRRKV